MAAISFNTSNQTYRQLIGNGLVYSVPRYQRDYSWRDEEWDDLWADILELLLEPGSEPAHYMGYIVLQTEDNKKFDIIDGQQRLTTLSLFALAVLSCLEKLIAAGAEPENNRLRKEQLRNTFIGYLDPVSLIPQAKLTLNRNNDSLYQHYIVPLQSLPARGLRATELLMKRAFQWFEDRVWRKFGSKNDGALLAEVLSTVSDKLFFTVITVADELNAYKVFETLNARGVRLSAADLLKNYLFSVVHRERADERELNTLDERWEDISGKLGAESFADFVRAHWNSRNKMTRPADLFKSIRATVTGRREVFELVRRLELDADVYIALSKPDDELWSGEQRIFVEELCAFGARPLYPLILSAYHILPPQEFTRLLRVCSVVVFRYSVICGLPANDLERVCADAAALWSNGEAAGLKDVLNALRSVYPDDRSFALAFSEKQLSTLSTSGKRVVRHMLFKIEGHVSGEDYERDGGHYSIEHVLPERPGDGWEQFSDRESEQFVYRLGNMTLLKTKDNREAGNASFENKKDAYASSIFDITRRIAAENNEWTTARIAARQRWMAEQAKTIWRISL